MLENYTSPYDAHVDRAVRSRGRRDAWQDATWTSSPWARRARSRISGRCATLGRKAACRAAPQAARRPRWPRAWSRRRPAPTPGGSIRQPAALSGICGLQARRTARSRAMALVAFASSLDQAGPLAQERRPTSRCCMNAMAGFDARDSTSLERPKEDYARSLRDLDLAGLRIGVPEAYFGEGVQPGVRAAVEEAMRWFTSQGAKRGDGRAAPPAASGSRCTTSSRPAEASSNLSRFDGVRYGHRARSTPTSSTCMRARAPRASAPK